MSEVREQVARAICNTLFGPFSPAELDRPSSISGQSMIAARAAIDVVLKEAETLADPGGDIALPKLAEALK